MSFGKGIVLIGLFSVCWLEEISLHSGLAIVMIVRMGGVMWVDGWMDGCIKRKKNKKHVM